ncbi:MULTISPECIES: SGNH/GDSL hydrolase family protein [Petrimonas]|jgi:lysophospholipase L1-like esterase|uniref:Platelet-activating factor acetylhydrolase IB subunit gamma n=1 Tax=Petrimonas mucosa TaxID=1642646 RepID=A0A1G4G850_9BACT|nr:MULTISPECIES: SGNH/GDSL hydrolase family protein [Petrimonas]MDD3560375.1 SGNH/GDSL hydrolase family protein [Petrimonas mucosa]SCM58606.1 Platelet-activating factor acetylhydrolase IB subunit gamma [Petrimonas mucosa]HHT28758.1 acetylhydrolase [Petrimonas mucosa]
MRTAFFIFSLLCVANLTAQTRWYDPMQESRHVIQNQGWTEEIGKSYQRLPDRAKKVVREPVWGLSENSAGLAIHFYTNATTIEIRYGVKGSHAMPHMPATGKTGVDLYAVDSDGKWRVATDRYNFGDTISYTFSNLSQSKYHKHGFEYRLYLPLYNTVTWMKIGVPDSAELRFIPVLAEKPIVVYGTSIAQGGCASRPGMGWTNILSRKLDYPVVNLAFSGNGPLEKELVDLMDEMDASLYIFDCLPNMGNLSSEEVIRRTLYGVKKLREKHDAPILIVDHIGYRNAELNEGSRETAERMNEASRQAFDSLRRLGVKNIHHLHKDSINMPMDGCVDNIHPTDLGMQVYADAYEKIVRKILNMPVGKITTTRPVSQRREPDIYEWKERHAAILKKLQTGNAERVIIGNSITHYWGGEPGREHGSRSWREEMEPAGFVNLGFGWDRVENVLWRVYHGELDGYRAKEVVLMIGTNNLGLNSENEIVDGLKFLLDQIRVRQPNAVIKVVGLLPRRGKEEVVRTINRQISEMAALHNYRYVDVGSRLLTADGKVDERLFLDGLHPNEKGYSLIVEDLLD